MTQPNLCLFKCTNEKLKLKLFINIVDSGYKTTDKHFIGVGNNLFGLQSVCVILYKCCVEFIISTLRIKNSSILLVVLFFSKAIQHNLKSTANIINISFKIHNSNTNIKRLNCNKSSQ